MHRVLGGIVAFLDLEPRLDDPARKTVVVAIDVARLLEGIDFEALDLFIGDDPSPWVIASPRIPIGST